MRALFVSDCHLSPAYPDTIARFKRFLTNEARAADALYILGDLFEYWLGDDDDLAEYDDICHALKTLSAQTPIACLRGNRDFSLASGFARRSGCRLLPDEYKLTLDGVDTLLMHGDLLCTDDRAYQRYRRVIQNRAVQGALLRMPLAWRKRLAQYLRRKSGSATMRKNTEIMDVNADAVVNTMRRHRVRLLIHGHTHRRAEHAVDLGDKQTGKRIVLGAWHPYDAQSAGNALALDKGQTEWLEL